MKSNFSSISFALALSSLAIANDSGKHLFILSGQSNMREPLIGSFTDTVKKALGENEVIVTSYGQPSQSIRRWYKKWTPPEGMTVKPSDFEMYDKLMAGVQKAIRGQTLKSVTYVWMQGEADAESGFGSRYEESFLGVLDQIKADLNLKDINFVIGRINDHWLPAKGYVDGDVIRALQVKMGESTPRGAWIDTDELNTGVNPWGAYEIDGGHFPNPGYRVMGRRFARQACELVAPNLKPDESLFAESFIDDARKVLTNVALGKPITGTAPDGGKFGLPALVDGKLGPLDPKDPAWLVYPPTEKNIGFIIDLGAATDISSVAVNLLVNHEASAHFPSKIDVSISENGSDYKHLLSGRSEVVSFDKHARQRNLSKDFKPGANIVFIDKQVPAVRFVKVEIVPDAAANARVLIDEIMVNPVMK